MRPPRFSALPVALFLLSVLWQASLIFQPAWLYGEGLILVGAERILLGEVPYRDFWNTHAPGQIAVVAAIFRLFGPSILAARVYDVLVRAGIAVACFMLARRMGVRAGAFVAWAAATVFLGCCAHSGYVTFPALLCALTGFLLLPAADNGRDVTPTARRRSLLLAGIAGGCSVLFRHDLGLEAVVAAVVVSWVGGAAGKGGPGGARQPGSGRLRQALWVLAGAGAATLPVAAFFLLAGTPLHRLREIFFDYPFLVYPAFRALPAPTAFAERLTVAVPAALVAAGLLRGMAGVRRAGGQEERDRRRTMLALGLLGVLAFPQAYTRLALAQQIPVVVSALALLPALFSLPARGGAARRALPLLAGAAALLVVLRFPLAASLKDLHGLLAGGALATAHGLPRAKWIPLAQSQVDAVKAVQAFSREGDPIYVGLGRHDRAFVNDALFYFLAARRPATYHHNLLPGLVTTEAVQREILADLERRSGMAVVQYTGADAVAEPNQSRFSSGVDLLDRAIRRDCDLVMEIPPYVVLWRRSGDADGGGKG